MIHKTSMEWDILVLRSSYKQAKHNLPCWFNAEGGGGVTAEYGRPDPLYGGLCSEPRSPKLLLLEYPSPDAKWGGGYNSSMFS